MKFIYILCLGMLTCGLYGHADNASSTTAASRPALIILYLNSMHPEAKKDSDNSKHEQLAHALEALQALSAIAQGVITIICTESVSAGTPQIVQGIEQFAQVISEEQQAHTDDDEQ